MGNVVPTAGRWHRALRPPGSFRGGAATKHVRAAAISPYISIRLITSNGRKIANTLIITSRHNNRIRSRNAIHRLRIIAAVPTRPLRWHTIKQVSLLLVDGAAGGLTLTRASGDRLKANKAQAIIETDVASAAGDMLTRFPTFKITINISIGVRRSNEN